MVSSDASHLHSTMPWAHFKTALAAVASVNFDDSKIGNAFRSMACDLAQPLHSSLTRKRKAGEMSKSITAVHNYLVSRFGITLEDALICASEQSGRKGVGGAVTVSTRSIAPGPDGRDDGIAQRFEGSIDVDGLVYQFCYSLITDKYGVRQIEVIERFEPVEWCAHVHIPF